MSPMLDWLKNRSSPRSRQRAGKAEAAAPPVRAMSGKYLSIYNYLENRYANTVVLTFAEIEDLLGFTLPDLARLNQEWWTNGDPNADPPSHRDSWILASRTAKANLLAQTVVFERA